MDHNPIGKTGIKLPSIIFGTSALGNLYSAPSDYIKQKIVSECVKHVSPPVVFDSAGKYGAGLALEKLGEILNNLVVDPDKVIISNKLGWIRKPLLTSEPEFEKGVWVDIRNDAWQNISYDGILECWQQGNELLEGKYRPQMVSVHDPDEYLAASTDEADFKKRLSDIKEAYRALAELKKNGEVKAIGVGAKNWKTIQLIAGETDLDWVMFANSMTIYRHPAELLSFMENLHSKGIAMINSAVFHAGFLTGGSFFDYVHIKPDSEENRSKFRWRDDFFSLCRKYDIRPSDACVRFALTPPGVVSISLNTSNPDRVKENVRSAEAVIPEEFWKEMVQKGLIDEKYPHLY
jgi:D-threo-aldose 1-dehydrogenase